MPETELPRLPLSPERVWARYWVETAFDVSKAAEVMAGEQSSGTFVQVPGETADLRERYANASSTQMSNAPSPARQAPVRSFPAAPIACSLPMRVG